MSKESKSYKNLPITMKAFLQTFGCPKNVVDSEKLAYVVETAGIGWEKDPAKADIIIVNTCGFIKPAVEESLTAVLEASLFKKHGRCRLLVVAGCLSKRYAGELFSKIKDVDCFIGPQSIGELENIIKEFKRGLFKKRRLKLDVSPERLARKLLTPFHYAYLKISDGCDNKCSYCTIPSIRGPLKSREQADIIEEVRKLVSGGVKELIIVGQDIAAYGMDRGKQELSSLLSKIEQINAVKWIRLMYLHPLHVTDELIGLIASSDKICKYVDMPIQHINSLILKKMDRRVTTEKVRELLVKLRKIEGAKIRSTFIVGFPGESEKAFEELMDFVKEIRFDRLGFFIYSREEGTKAYSFDNVVSKEVAESRLMRLAELQKKISMEINKRLTGETIEVIIDRSAEGKNFFYGRSRWDAPEVDCSVKVSGKGLNPGDIVKVIVEKAFPYELEAKLM
ncbi:MAG: 30S ribosomal protein S12 methylthiotransferase RimO [Candidatus Aureabacteria bacterium]|nr:30S ribosomal protein S12 methylthiotransferase RimO [Candidatus Auribacterota bacterium]